MNTTIAGRVGGVEADQVLEQFGGALIDGGVGLRHDLLLWVVEQKMTPPRHIL